MVQEGVGVVDLLVMQDGVALREGTTLDILTGAADMLSFKQEGAPRQSFGGGPVDILAGCKSLATVLDDSVQVAVDVEVLGKSGQGLADLLESFHGNTGVRVRQDLFSALLGRLEARPRAGEPLTRGRLVVLAASIAFLQNLPDALLVGFNFILGQASFLLKLFGVQLSNGSLLSNSLVHLGLGEAGLVSFVVTVLAVADKIDNNVSVEGLAPVSSKLHDESDSFSVIAVYVENGCVDGFGDIGTVRGRATEARISGETDLVVDDNVDSTASAVGRQIMEAHGFVDNTLTSKGSVTVHQDSHRVLALGVLAVELEGASLTQDNGVDSFQVRWVRNKGKVDTLARGSRTNVVHTKMVLDITGAFLGRFKRAAEFAKDGFVGLADDVAQDIQTATVRHTDNDRFNTKVDGAVNLSKDCQQFFTNFYTGH